MLNLKNSASGHRGNGVHFFPKFYENVSKCSPLEREPSLVGQTQILSVNLDLKSVTFWNGLGHVLVLKCLCGAAQHMFA